METRLNRRDLLKAVGLAAGTSSWALGRAESARGEPSRAKEKLFLLRYDTERGDQTDPREENCGCSSQGGIQTRNPCRLPAEQGAVGLSLNASAGASKYRRSEVKK